MTLDEYIISSLTFCKPVKFDLPETWVQQNIDLSLDMSSGGTGLVDLDMTPYLRKPLNFWQRESGGKMTCVAVEQTGKSSVWKWGVLWRLVNRPGPSLIVYPSDSDAADTNADSFEPLMGGIEKLKLELDRPKAKRKDCYRFTFGTVYFSGGGSDIISKPLQIVVGDEVDYWIQHLEKVDNVRNLDKRTRTFSDGLRVLVCSPTKDTGIIWREFKDSSRGYWHMRCLGCEKLTMRSADVFNLQWELDSENNVIEDSLRLICPECKTEHVEDEKRKMNIAGDYIHDKPERIEEHEGYQWGALASQFWGLRWIEIAKAQMQAGKSGLLEDQKLFDNSFRGLPFIPRKSSDSQMTSLKQRIAPLPDLDTIENVFMTADTQDDCFYYRIRSLDINGNTHPLTPVIKAMDFDELEKSWKSNYMGITPIMGLIDAGGHRTEEVMQWVSKQTGFFAYKGDSRIGVPWKVSSENRKLLLGNAKLYLSKILYYLYSQKNRDNNYWYMHPDETEDTLSQIAAVKPNPKIKNGDDYENWTAPDGNDHIFDCEKMMLMLFEVAKKWLTADRWRKGGANWAKKSTIKMIKPESNNSGWVYGWK